MAASKLDQLVKGAAPPTVSVPDIKSREPSLEPEGVDGHESPYGEAADPTAILPSSPPQIYLNLLILEASLRSQYLTLRSRRRQNTCFLFLLAIWNAFFSYALFLRPREDGIGIGGSVYWVVETAEKVALMGGIVTGILIWGTGQWERGVRWPRRFVAITNRGLRTMNCKIVVTKGPWWKETVGKLACFLPFSSYYVSHGSSYHYVETTDRRHPATKQGDGPSFHEEDLAPGGDCIKLLLLPKPFSPDFRENWELYRTEYWERENGRRAQLRQRLRKQLRQHPRDQGGWLWWLGLSRSGPAIRDSDLEKTHLVRATAEKDAKRLSVRRGEPHSRNASRSSTPASLDGDERPPSRGSRSAGAEGRRRQRGSSTTGKKGSSRLSGAALERSAPMPMSMATQPRRASGFSGTGNESDAKD